MRPRAACLLAAVVFMPLATTLHAQQPVQLKPTASDAAVAEFRSALYEAQNLAPAKARAHVAAALAAAPQFGLARVYQAMLATGLTAPQREAQVAQNLGAMGPATPAEVLLALYWREAAAGRGPASVPILKAAVDLVPGDAEIAYLYHGTQRAGKPATEQVAMLRSFLERFPSHAAAYNQLAYTSWTAGDREGSLAAVQQYVRHAPNHPNSHDSYADILLLLGRGPEAIPHVEREIELDPDFGGAHAKLGAIRLTMGDVAQARNHFAEAARRATTPAERIEAMYWQATADIYARDSRAAGRQLVRVVELAKSENMPGALALAHDRSAVLAAYLGNRNTVAAHLVSAEAAATNDNQRATYQAHAAIALSRSGRTADARTAASAFAAIVGAENAFINTLDALLALDAKDYRAAEAAIARITTRDLLARSLRAELLLRTGRKTEGDALRTEVLAASVKVDGNPPMDFNALIGRMRAAAL